MKRLFLIIVLMALFIATKAQKELTPMDNGSKLHFVIKNFGIKTGGDLSGLKGSIKFDAKNPAGSSFDVTVRSSSIDTDNDSRDNHLRKEEYFDVENYPVIRMVSSKVQATVKPGRFQFNGSLTIKNTTKPIQFQFVVEEKEGGYLFISDNITLNRRDYGVGSSSISLSDELKLTISVLAK